MAATNGKQGDDPDPARDGPQQPPDLGALFAAHADFVRAFVRLRMDPLTRRRDAVSDIVQSACREVLANKNFEYRGEAAFRSYLCQAAMHKLQEHRRHHLAHKRDVQREEQVEICDDDLRRVYSTTFFDPTRRAIRAEECRQLEAAFDRLPEGQREVLLLYRIAGLSVAEIAGRIGKTEAATKMMLHRAMARLTSLLPKPE